MEVASMRATMRRDRFQDSAAYSKEWNRRHGVHSSRVMRAARESMGRN
jgi:hypothetical protein